jgi:prepilin-type N-terminal cleavage/methylation domain-containing protein
MMENKITFRPLVRQRGFTLIECLISMAVLTIGSVGLLSVFGLAMKATQSSQENLIARQLANETMESIYTARNSSEISWPQIQNVSNGGIFINGINAVMCAGPDGILDTADDISCLTASGATCPNGGVECLTEPGPDGILGTADDIIVSLSNYRRQVQVQQLLDTNGNPIQTLSLITVTIQYSSPDTGGLRTYVLNEYVSAYH